MARPVTVLMVINELRPGGAQRSVAELVPHLARGGVRPIVACLEHTAGGLEDQLNAQGFDVRVLPARRFAARPRDLRDLAAAVRGLRSIIRREDPDVVHTTLFPADVVGRLASATTRAATLTSLVSNAYGPERFRDPHVRPSRLHAMRLIEGWTGRHLNDHFHAVSQAVKASAQATLKIPGERITVVHRGRDPGRLGRPDRVRRRAARRRLSVDDDAQVIVNVGSHDYTKGHATLLEATALLVAERPGVVLLQAGREGRASPGLRDLVSRRALQANVRLLGHRDDVPELLAASDLFVLPSLDEGFGGSVVEAMALGLPIVASDTPAMREVLQRGRNALLVPPQRPRELAAAVRRILDDDECRRSFGERSREIFEARFTIQRSAEGMIALYHDVVVRRRRTTAPQTSFDARPSQ